MPNLLINALLLTMPLDVCTANGGSFGKNIGPGKVCPVLKNTMNLQYSIRGFLGKFCDVMGFQENQNESIILAPGFGLPIAVDEFCNIGYEAMDTNEWVKTKRGTCTYAAPGTTTIAIPDFPKIEACITVHDYTDWCNGWKTKQVAYFNIYRNQHELSDGASASTIVNFVRTMLARLKSLGIEEALICGDFNFEGSMNFGFGMRELRDKDLFHKHNSTTQTTRIDRCFTNCPHAKITHVFKTIENKSDYVDENGVFGDDLGHKPFLVRIGRDKKFSGSYSFSCKRFKSEVVNFHPNAPPTPITLDDIENSAEYLVKVAQTLAKVSRTWHSKKKAWKPEELAIDMLEKAGDNIWKRKDCAAKFYNIADDFMGKVKATEGIGEPSLEKFKEFHEKKLATIINPDFEKCDETIREMYENRPKTQINFPSKKDFKKIILKSSNSGALDFYGISLKQQKIIFKHNKQLFNIFYATCKAIARTGHIPWMWKKDKISFLFKQKGTRDNPKFYRPITIACGFGKMFDRVLMDRWTRALDFNFDNHAYLRGKSCTSAIAEVHNYLRDIRMEASMLNIRLLTFICAEDISSAFESIAHRIIELYAELTFESSDFNMPKLTRSYLDRKSFISDNKSTDFLEVCRLFTDQTSPQGSSNSPPWWRVYDGGFSHIFKRFLSTLKLKNGAKIHDVSHISYADDHLVAITLNLEFFSSDAEVEETIFELSKCIRQDLIKSTQIFGCAVNPDKSEILVPKHLKSDPKDKSLKIKLKSEFVWLGYSLEVEDNYLNFTTTRMRSRFHTVYEKFHSMCQYLKSINVKKKIYDVYISPVVDWFTPTILPGKWHSNSRANEIAVFQQKCLSVVVGVCGNVDRTALNNICGIRSVFDNCTLVASRLVKFYERDTVYLKGETVSARMSLRSGRISDPDLVWNNCDHFDLGDRVNFIASTRKMSDVPKFSSVLAKIWAINQNHNIRFQINMRTGIYFTF